MIRSIKLLPMLLLSVVQFTVGNYCVAQEIKAVQIGSQIWMTENLNVDHYRNGDSIPEVKTQSEWQNLKTGAWCYYKNDPVNGEKYGKLYNWYALKDVRGLAPNGWHIPSTDEFQALQAAVQDNSNKLKAIGQGTGSGAGTNETGFSALLGGYRGYKGSFYYLEYDSYLWSSSEGLAPFANSMYLYSSGRYLFFYDFDKVYGFSVRCIKD